MKQNYMTFPVYSQITVPTLVWLIFERTSWHEDILVLTTPGCYRPTLRLSVPKTEAACCRQSLIVYCGLYAAGHCMFQLLNPSYNDYACPPPALSPPPPQICSTSPPRILLSFQCKSTKYHFLKHPLYNAPFYTIT